MIRLARMISLNGQSPALELASLYCQIDLSAALVSGYDSKFRSKNVFQHFRNITSRCAGAGGAAFWRLGSSPHIGEALGRQIGAHIEEMIGFIRAADPAKSSPIEFYLLLFHELVEEDRR